MAKRKHAAALFEVFHNTNKPTSRPAPSAPSRGYGWWFKGRMPSGAEGEEPQVFDENDPTTMTIRSPLLAPRIAAVEAMEPPSAPARTSPPMPKIKPAAVFNPPPPVESREPAATVAGPADRVEPYDGPARLHLDRQRREITLRLPFNTALIAACGVFLCVGVAYVAGRHIGSREKEAASVATAPAENTHAANVRASVLEVPRRPSRVATAPPAAAPAERSAPRPAIPNPSRYHDHESTPMANNVHGLPSLAPQTAINGPRIIGLNYLLIQNYPNKESAVEARDFLLQSGINCTVEKVPPGFFCPDPAWMSVITTRGFTREEMHAAEFDAFRKKIEKLSEKFAGTGKFKRFAILAYQLK